jgi:hypothetical protein
MITMLDLGSCKEKQEKLKIEHARTLTIHKTKARMTSNEAVIF